MSLPSLPTFLEYLPACRVILCRRHGCTLTSQDVGVHLNIFHGCSSKRGNHISATARELGAAFKKSDAVVHMNGSATIFGLKLHQGHDCQVASDCQWLGVGKKAFRSICRKSTASTVKRDGHLIAKWLGNVSLRGRYHQPLSLLVKEDQSWLGLLRVI